MVKGAKSNRHDGHRLSAHWNGCMKREGTIGAAAFLAIAAAVGISVQSGTKQGGAEDSPGRFAASRKAGNPRHTKSTVCDELREHLEDFLDSQKNSFPTPCAPGKSKSLNAASKANLQFVIATLPDPRHTHLSVSFDEATATIQEAAQDDGYDFDSSWLPWEQQEEQTYARLDDQKMAEQDRDDQEKQPGVLLFRKTVDLKEQPGVSTPSQAPFFGSYQNGLIVFVVGEDATHGIHQHQFRNALEWIKILSAMGQGRTDQIVILGPSFSGSFPSLAELLSNPDIASTLGLADTQKSAPVPIYSGSVSGRGSAVWFQRQMDEKYGKNTPRVIFHSFVMDDDQILDLFSTYMHAQQSPVDDGKVAILSEDETAYGSEAMKEDTAPGDPGLSDWRSQALKVYYPRDISALRGAYQTKSLFNNSSSEESQNQQRRNLPTDLADPAGIVHDSVRSYGANQTPLVQEAFLLELVTALRERGARYVVLRGSNPLDQLFLTNFLRRLYPDARIVIVTPDLLFMRERGATGLSGVMTLSTYPLSSLARHWTERPLLPANDRVFSSDGSEGLYNAFRLLINADLPEEKLPKKCRVSEPAWLPDKTVWRNSAESETQLFLPTVVCIQSPIADYAPPLWIDRSSCVKTEQTPICSYPGPAAWLSVIGVNRFWPLLPMNGEGASAEIPALEGENKPSQGTLRPPLLMKLLLLAVLSFSLFHLLCCWGGSYMAKPSFRAYFASSGDPKQTTLVALGSSLVVFLGLISAWSCGVFHAASVAMPYSRFACYCTVTTALLAWSACILHNYRVNQLNPVNKAASQPKDAVAAKNDTVKATKETKSAAFYRRLRKWTRKPLYRLFFAGLFPLLAILFFIFVFVVPLESVLRPENRVLTYWRAMNLGSGLSPIMPFISLFIGLYIAFWYTLHGLALFGPDRPRLPRPKQLEFQIPEPTKPGENTAASTEPPATQEQGTEDGKQVLRMFTQDAANDIEFAGKPLTFARRTRLSSKGGEAPDVTIQLGAKFPVTVLLFLLFGTVSAVLAGGVPIRSLGHENYAIVFLGWFLLSSSLMLALCYRMYMTWSELRQLLEYLDRIPLRRTMDALRGFSWGSVWKMSGNVLEVRYKLISRQLESMNHTIASLQPYRASADTPITMDMATDSMKCLEDMREAGHGFAKWYLQNYTNPDAGDLNAFRTFQKRVANVSGSLIRNLLLPVWRSENESLVLVSGKEPEAQATSRQLAPLAKDECVRNAEEFVCLTYMGFVQNILGRLRTMAIAIVALFLSCCIAISSYPFDPRQALSGVLIALFIVSSATIIFVYAGMHRDATLSHLTNTTPGELGSEFWMKLLLFVSPPLLGLLTRVFPGITDFIFAWLQPGLSSLK